MGICIRINWGVFLFFQIYMTIRPPPHPLELGGEERTCVLKNVLNYDKIPSLPILTSYTRLDG